MAFSIDPLVTPLDATKHAREIARLRQCRSVADLDNLAREGWLISDPLPGAGRAGSDPRDPRLKLIRHGSGTFMVVEYVDGWSKRLSQHLYGR
jgi:hypothetical protein